MRLATLEHLDMRLHYVPTLSRHNDDDYEQNEIGDDEEERIEANRIKCCSQLKVTFNDS